MIKFFKRKENTIILALALLFVITTSVYAALTDEQWAAIEQAAYDDELQQTPVSNSSNMLNIDSVGGDIFKNFYSGLEKWFGGDGVNPGIYQKFADAVQTPFEIGLTIAILIVGIAMYFGRWVEHARKFIKLFFATIIFIGFLDYETFAYWIFEPMLGLLIGVMKILLGASGNVNLTDAIFAIDGHFSKLFNAVDKYTTMLGDNDGFFDIVVDKKIVAWLMVLVFGGLYAIFTILIIVGFFGFILLLGFAPIFMAIGVFSKGIFLSWLKSLMNYFLIPIFTAAVMSITLSFIGQATDVVSNLTFEDSIYIKEIGYVFLVGIFSVGLHWKAPEFAAAITGGMASGAGSIVGTAAAVGGAAWAFSKSPLGGAKNTGNFISGWKGGAGGNSMSSSYRTGQAMQGLYEKFRTGGIK
jgi:hypothetical protein